MLSIHVVLEWDRRATVQIDPDVCVHELLERAQDALQQGISSLTTTSGQLLAGGNTACCNATKIAIMYICIYTYIYIYQLYQLYIIIIYPCRYILKYMWILSQILPIHVESNNPTWLN